MLYIAACSLSFALFAELSTAGDLIPTQMITVGNKRCKLENGCRSRSDWLKDDDWMQCGNQKYPNRCRAKCDGFDFDDKNGPCKSCDKDPSYKSPSIDLPCTASDCASMPRQTDCPDCSIYQECCAGNDGKCGWNIYPHSDHRYLRCLSSCGKSGYPKDGKSGYDQFDNKQGMKSYDGGNYKSGYDGKQGMGPYDGGKFDSSDKGKSGYDHGKDDYSKQGMGGKSDYGMSGKDDYGKQGMPGYDDKKSSYDGYPGKSDYGMPGKDDYGKQGMQGMPGYDDKRPDNYYQSDKGGKSDYGMPGKDDYGKQGMGPYDGNQGKDGMSGYPSKGYGPSDGGKSDYGMPPKDDYKGYPPKDGQYDVKPGYGWSGNQGDGKYGSDGGNKGDDDYSSKNDGKSWPTIKD